MNERLHDNIIHLQGTPADYLQVRIIAEDGGVPQLSDTSPLTLRLDDVNEFAPVFEQMSYEISAQTTAPNGTYLTQVLAMDRDGRDNIIAYSIVSNRSGPEFSIDRNGILRNNERFPVTDVSNVVSRKWDYDR